MLRGPWVGRLLQIALFIIDPDINIEAELAGSNLLLALLLVVGSVRCVQAASGLDLAKHNDHHFREPIRSLLNLDGDILLRCVDSQNQVSKLSLIAVTRRHQCSCLLLSNVHTIGRKETRRPLYKILPRNNFDPHVRRLSLDGNDNLRLTLSDTKVPECFSSHRCEPLPVD